MIISRLMRVDSVAKPIQVKVIAFILSCSICGVAKADLNLDIRDDLFPAVPVDYPFVYPFTGTTEVGEWKMTCQGGICETGQTNFGSKEHAVPNKHHTGEDWFIGAQSIQTQFVPIYSINHGVVIFAGEHKDIADQSQSKTGYLVIIKHRAPSKPFLFPGYSYGNCGRLQSSGEFVYSYYLHLDERLRVKTGENVFKGQIIGNTYTMRDVVESPKCRNGKGSPYTYCPHLHFELWSSVKVAPGDQSNDNDGYADQGCAGTMAFGYQLAKLLEPQAFIQANNVGPIIQAIDKTEAGDLVIRGSGFGFGGGSVEVLPCHGNTEDSSLDFVPANGNWQDNEIWLSHDLIATGSALAVKNLHPPLRLRVRSGAGTLSNHKNFPFTDVSCGNWYATDLIDLWCEKLITGKEKEKCIQTRAGGCSFAPEGTATRAEFVVLLVRSLHAECSDSSPCQLQIPFGDVPATEWYYSYVRAAYNREWIRASSAFRPDDKVNRAEAVAIVASAFGILNTRLECNGFVDVRDPSEWYHGSVCAMSSYGIVGGYNPGYKCDGTPADHSTATYFCPEKNLSRAEAVAIISRALGKQIIRCVGREETN